MANTISNDHGKCEELLQLSNGGMSVVIVALALAGSRLARQPWEIELITWLASRDQGVLGLGMVGFDLSDLPWSGRQEMFVQQRTFLMDVVRRAKTKVDLDVLDYDPPHLPEYMETLERMLTNFAFESRIDEEVDWTLKPDQFGVRCEQHGVLLHLAGCVVCNE